MKYTYLVFEENEYNEWICVFDSTNKDEAYELAQSICEDREVEIRVMKATSDKIFNP
ncbi:hypothetical protein LCGC14_2077060 [marine sediment metagenome]|uniref:Uncharacterized protein n=1 Tax=marine sediment metagenome TaxID=412755 RepID=A0A0F9F422_9ZZZZ